MRSASFATIVTALALLASSASANSYFIWDDYGGTWVDAEKTSDNDDDDLLCWAASSSNILWYTGWGWVDGMDDPDVMFAYFQDHWSDYWGHAYYGIDWWFDGENDMQGNAAWAQEDVDGGGGFYPSENYGDYVVIDVTNANVMDNINTYLHDGYAMALGIRGDMAHQITVWGYEYDSTGYLGVYVTDSDDDMDGVAPRPDNLAYYDVVWNSAESRWYMEGGYYGDGDDNYIGEILGLQIKPGFEPVPEPATIVLLGLGLGLIGLVRTRRRRR